MEGKMKKLSWIFLIMLIISNGIAQDQKIQPQKARPLYGGYIGLGYGILTDKLSEHFHNPIMLPITVDLVYKSLVAQFNLDAGWAKVKKTMTFSDGRSWDKGQNAFHEVFGINLGFSVYNTKDIRITPLVGYSYNSIYKYWWKKSDIHENEPDSDNLNVGFIVDLKNTFISKSNSADTQHDDYAGLRFSAGAYIPYSDHGVNAQFYDGMTIYLSVGVAMLNFF
jgi:hypothetical protein